MLPSAGSIAFPVRWDGATLMATLSQRADGRVEPLAGEALLPLGIVEPYDVVATRATVAAAGVTASAGTTPASAVGVTAVGVAVTTCG